MIIDFEKKIKPDYSFIIFNDDGFIESYSRDLNKYFKVLPNSQKNKITIYRNVYLYNQNSLAVNIEKNEFEDDLDSIVFCKIDNNGNEIVSSNCSVLVFDGIDEKRRLIIFLENSSDKSDKSVSSNTSFVTNRQAISTLSSKIANPVYFKVAETIKSIKWSNGVVVQLNMINANNSIQVKNEDDLFEVIKMLLTSSSEVTNYGLVLVEIQFLKNTIAVKIEDTGLDVSSILENSQMKKPIIKQLLTQIDFRFKKNAIINHENVFSKYGNIFLFEWRLKESMNLSKFEISCNQK